MGAGSSSKGGHDAIENGGDLFKEERGDTEYEMSEDEVVDDEKTFAEEVNSVLREASDTYLKGVLGVTDKPLVSSDYRCSDESSTIDSSLTMVMGDDMVKVVAWYDNEWGYSQRVVDLAELVASKSSPVSSDPMDALCAEDPSSEECKVFDE